jgi:hypothetical protein
MTRRKGFAVRRALSSLLLVGIAGALCAVAVPGCSKGGDGSPTLVTVGSRRISVADFEAYGRDPQIIAPYQQLPDSVAKRTLLEDLLSYELFAEAATRQGLDKDTAYANIEETVLPRLLPDALYESKISALVKSSDEEARLFHEKQKKEYQLGVIRTADSTSMRTLIARLDRGESFEEVARTGSQDPTTAGQGGRIEGWLTIGQLPPDVETAVAPLAKGGRTGIVAQRTGSYVFQVFDVRDKVDPVPFEQAKEQVKASLEARKRGALVDKYLLGLKSSYALKVEGPGWDVVRGKFLAAPDSVAARMVMDAGASGLSADERKQTVATWKGRVYTVGDLLSDIGKADPQERPPLVREDAVQMFIEGHAMNDILVAEAKKQKLDTSPQVKRQLARAKAAFLVNKYLEKNLSQSSLGSPTPAELDSVTAALVAGMGGTGGGPVPKFADLPPVIQQQIANEWMEKKRQALLKAEVERLKAEIKPVVDEKQFARIAWPVPPAAA